MTTTVGFEREDTDTFKTGVMLSSRARFTAALGRPGGFGSSAMPKTRQHNFDLQTQAPGGRPNFSQISVGMYLYCDSRLGSAAQASAFLPKQGGPAGIYLPAHQPRDLRSYNGRGGKEYPWIISGYPWIISGYPWISMDIQGYPGLGCINSSGQGVFKRMNSDLRVVLTQYA